MRTGYNVDARGEIADPPTNLGVFAYQKLSEGGKVRTIQSFKASSDTPYSHVRFSIDGNYGNGDFTCVYRYASCETRARSSCSPGPRGGVVL